MSTLNVTSISPVVPGGSTDFSSTSPPTFNGAKTGFGFSEIETVAGTSYTLTDADIGKTLRFTSASAVSVTAPSGLATWGLIRMRQAGAGLVTVVAGPGVTVTSPATLAASGQHASLTLHVTSSTVYDLSGDVA
jgi:hypothetical protein